MAGSLGMIPTEGDLIARFAAKDTVISVSVARQLIEAVSNFWKDTGRKGGGAKPEKPATRSRAKPKPADTIQERVSTPVQQPTPVAAAPVEPKPEPKPEVAPIPSPPIHRPRMGVATRSTSYGRR